MTDPQIHPRPALVFDLGGVLIDWNPRYLYRRYFPDDPQAIERFLSETSFFAWNVTQDAGLPFAEAVAEISARHPQYAELFRAYDEYYEETISGPIQPTVEILGELKQAGYPLYALSNWPSEKFYRVRPKFDFLGWFDRVLVSGDVGLVKPDPRIFTLLLEQIGRPAEACIFIDDSDGNVGAAMALGFQTIRFCSPEQLRSDLARLGI
jgi:2-haloacid dehalogenase